MSLLPVQSALHVYMLATIDDYLSRKMLSCVSEIDVNKDGKVDRSEWEVPHN